MLRKIAYTTGDVARICSVTINTVVKWFETGSLKGYKIPGSGARRIPHENLLEFMKKHGMPLRGLDRKGYKALLVTADAEVLKAFADALDEEKEVSLLSTADAIQAGLLVARERPDIVFADLQAPGGFVMRSWKPIFLTRVSSARPDFVVSATRRACLVSGFSTTARTRLRPSTPGACRSAKTMSGLSRATRRPA